MCMYCDDNVSPYACIPAALGELDMFADLDNQTVGCRVCGSVVLKGFEEHHLDMGECWVVWRPNEPDGVRKLRAVEDIRSIDDIDEE